MLIVGRRQLDHILRVYVHHYNGHWPHRALDLETPDVVGTPSACGGPITSAAVIRRRDLLGGLLHEYEAAAA